MGKDDIAYANPSAPSFIQKLRTKHGLKSREEQQQDQLSLKMPKHRADDDGDDPSIKDDELPVCQEELRFHS